MNEIKKRITTESMRLRDSQRIGEWGEKKALNYLLDIGYQVVAKNLRYKNYEVDLIAVDKNSRDLVFIEVKSSLSNYFGSPSLRVGREKLNSMQCFARAFLRNYIFCHNFRFDIIAVTPATIDHYQNITW